MCNNICFLCPKDMDWTTVLLVPAVVVMTAGFFYLYSTVLRLMSKTTVRNKVVLITNALSGLGNGNGSQKLWFSFSCYGDTGRWSPFKFRLIVLQSVPRSFIREVPGWSYVGKVGRSWSLFLHSWLMTVIPPWWVTVTLFIYPRYTVVSHPHHQQLKYVSALNNYLSYFCPNIQIS